MARRNGQANKASRPGRLRIVAGKWRSRLLPIADAEGLRPTSERVRETVFNWLAREVAGSHCLDVFAGTGALGFEALSRGAASATLLEISPEIAGVLESSARRLDATNVRIVCTDALTYLQQSADQTYDVVFLDPPFAEDLMEECCRLLHSNGWLTEHAAVYMEQGKGQATPALPPEWHVAKEKKAGNVKYVLARTSGEPVRSLVQRRAR